MTIQRLHTSAFVAVLTAVIIVFVVFAVMKFRPSECAVSDINEEVDSLFHTVFPEHAPGAVVAVFRDDSIMCLRCYGRARLDQNLPSLTPEYKIHIAALARQMSAVGLMRLAQEGKISMTDKLSRWFPELENKPVGDIMLWHILSRSSAIPDLRPANDADYEKYLQRHRSPYSKCVDWQLYASSNEVVKFLQDVEILNFTPSSHYDVYDISSMLQSVIIERVTGQSYHDWMLRNVFITGDFRVYATGEDYCEMSRAYARARDAAKPGTFRSADERWDEYDYGEAEFFNVTYGPAIYTDIVSMAQWYMALYRGEIIGKDACNKYFIPLVDNAELPMQTSLFSYVDSSESGMPKIYDHGFNGGFCAVSAYWRHSNTGYVILSLRRDWNVGDLFRKLDDILRRNRWI